MTSWPCPNSSDTATGDTLAPKGTPVVVPAAPPEPVVLAVAIRPKSKGDEDKLMTGLHRLQEEDRALVVERVDETHQTILRGTGETHLAVAAERLARKFGVEVATEDVLVPFRETIIAAGRGRGQVQEADRGPRTVRRGLDPHRAPRARRGLPFRRPGRGGAIPKQYIPAVEKGVLEAMNQGGVHGYPVVDVQVTCFDGKFHPVDSSEMSFKMAGSLAFKEAMAKAGPALLEPISLLEVTVPATMQGDVLGDLNSRRGRVQGTDTVDGGVQKITALVPTAEIQRYAVDLRSLTGGRGRFRAAPRPLRRHAVEPRRAHGQGQTRLTRRARVRRGSGQAPCRRSHPTVSDSGMTRTPATVVMKLVSPDHRGRTWRWRCPGIPAPAARPRLAPMLMPSGS